LLLLAANVLWIDACHNRHPIMIMGVMRKWRAAARPAAAKINPVTAE
jgi:hypothetical protein